MNGLAFCCQSTFEFDHSLICEKTYLQEQPQIFVPTHKLTGESDIENTMNVSELSIYHITACLHIKAF